MGLEHVDGIGARQQGAGAAAQCFELFDFAVIGQDEQNRQIEKQGVQAQYGAELFAVHISQFLRADDHVGHKDGLSLVKGRQHSGRVYAGCHAFHAAGSCVTQSAPVKTGQRIAFAKKKNVQSGWPGHVHPQGARGAGTVPGRGNLRGALLSSVMIL